MIAKYNNSYYTYVKNKRKQIILTRDKGKSDDTFSFGGQVYRKTISEDDLTDIFDLEIMVLYKSGLKGVSDWWKVGHESPLIDKDGTILLLFAEGLLPEWKIIEKNVCSCRISVGDIQMAKLVLSYKKKDGVKCLQPIKDERLIYAECLATLDIGR